MSWWAWMLAGAGIWLVLSVLVGAIFGGLVDERRLSNGDLDRRLEEHRRRFYDDDDASG